MLPFIHSAGNKDEDHNSCHASANSLQCAVHVSITIVPSINQKLQAPNATYIPS